MAFITRGIKAGSGTTAWVDGVGKIILSVEANLDLDTVYTIINGGLENDNVKAAAGIVYSKLNLTGGIIGADVNAAANIPGTTLLTASLPGDKLIDLGVTTAKLANNAVSKSNSASANNALVLAVAGAWTDIATPQVVGHVLASAPAGGLFLQLAGALQLTNGVNPDPGDSVGMMIRLVTRVGGVDTVRGTFLSNFTPFTAAAATVGVQPAVPFSHAILVTGLPAATYDFKAQYYIFASGVAAPQFTLSPAVTGVPVSPERHLVVLPLFK